MMSKIQLEKKMYKLIKITLLELLMAFVILFSWSLSQSYAVAGTVTIDGSIEHQTIEGLGGRMETHPEITGNNLWDVLFNEVGASALYILAPPDYTVDQWEPIETIPMLKQAKNYGVKLFYAGFSSPKAQWKDTGDVNYGSLLPEYYDDFAYYILDYINYIKTETGIDITHIAPFGEPTVNPNTGYPHCFMTEEAIVDFLKVAGPIIRNANSNIKTHIPVSGWIDDSISYTNNIMPDATARNYIDILSTHTYNWPTRSNAQYWQTFANIAQTYGKETAHTEVCHDNNPAPHPAGIYTGKWIREAFVDGQAIMFQWWDMLDRGQYSPKIRGFVFSKDWPPGEFSSDGITKVGYAFKQYAHWVRPGAIRVEATSDDSHVLVSSYKHPTDNTFTLVAINDDTQDKTVTFNINNLNSISSLNAYRTSATENSADLGQVSVINNSFTYTLPKESTTTFAGQIILAIETGMLKINEIRVDDAGTDDVEFIEFTGLAGTDITGFKITHYDGDDASDGGLWTHTIGSFTIPDDGITDVNGNALGFYVLGCGVFSGSNVDESRSDTIQNGPDGIVLYDSVGNILDAVAWEGAGDLSINDPGTVTTSGDSAANNYLHVTIDDDDGDNSLQAPNDVSGDDGSGWCLASATIGAKNTNQTSSDITLPVELSTFTAIHTDTSIILKWIVESEVDNVGWDIYRSTSKDGPFTKINDVRIPGADNSATHHYRYIDEDVVDGVIYFYYLEDVDISGVRNKSKIIQSKPLILTKRLEVARPTKSDLLQNYPNPFNPDTWIPYQLAKDTEVMIKIYNALGELVRTLKLGHKTSGYYLTAEKAAYWNGRNNDRDYVASGVYFYQLQAGEFFSVKKMLLLK